MDPTIHKIVAVAPELQWQHLPHHCLQHPVMLCIDLVASRQGGGAWTNKEQVKDDISSLQLPSPHSQQADSKRLKLSPQYLCTGYDLYVTMEPCVM